MTQDKRRQDSQLPVLPPTRRDIMSGFARCGGAVAVVSLAGCTFADVYGGLEARAVQFDLTQAQFEPLREVGGMVAIDEGAWRAVLVRRSETEMISLDRMCPHEWCDMIPGSTGLWSDDSLWCLCHGSRFDAQGKVMVGPAVDDIPAYRVDFDAETGTGTLFMEVGMMGPEAPE